mgnify:CR=1 FL=1
MKKSLIFVLVSIVMLTSSCKVFKKYAESRAILEDEARVFVKPLVADLKVEETRRTWSVTFTKKEVLLYGNNTNLCRYACWIATHNGNENSPAAYDAIVAPTYVVKPSKKQTVVEISGYPAKFESIQTLKESDEQILKFGIDPFYDSVVVPAGNKPVIFGRKNN